MGVGTLKWSGTATIPAGTPGVAGEVDVALASLAATDSVICTLSHTSEQSGSTRRNEEISYQVIKTASTGFKVKSNNKQNSAFNVDYIVMTRSS